MQQHPRFLAPGRKIEGVPRLQVVRRSATRSQYLVVLLALLALALHLALMRESGGTIDALVLIGDGVLTLLLVSAAFVHVQRVARERRRAALREAIAGFAREPQGIARTAASAIETLTAFGLGEHAIVALTDSDGMRLNPVAAIGYPGDWIEQAPTLSAGLLREPLPAVTRGGPAPWVQPITAGGRVPWVALLSLDTGPESLGVLLVAGRDRRPYRDRGLLRLAGEEIGVAIHWAALYEASYQRERELEEQESRRREFLAAIAHEVRTPLTSIQAFADLLLVRESEAGADSDLAASLRRGVDRLTGLVGDLLDLARVQRESVRPTPAPVEVRELLRSVETLLRPALMVREQRVTIELPETPLVAYADATLVEHILLNLLSNANRHTPDGGAIAIRATDTGNGNVRIDVCDSGPGIDPPDRERIFEPYYRVRRPDGHAVPGSGLGLAVARRLAELQGGRVWVDDRAEPGSCFSVELPMRRAPAPGGGADLAVP